MSILKEDNGNFSMTRVLSIIIVLSGLGIGLILAFLGKLDTHSVTLVLGLW